MIWQKVQDFWKVVRTDKKQKPKVRVYSVHQASQDTMIYYAQKGQLEELKKFVHESHGSIDPVQGFRAAAKNGHTELLEFFLTCEDFDLGKRTYLKEFFGEIFITACSDNHLNVVKYILSKNEPNFFKFETYQTQALEAAAKKDNTNIISYFINECESMDKSYGCHQLMKRYDNIKIIYEAKILKKELDKKQVNSNIKKNKI